MLVRRAAFGLICAVTAFAGCSSSSDNAGGTTTPTTSADGGLVDDATGSSDPGTTPDAAAGATPGAPDADAGPIDFWQPPVAIPPAKNVMMFAFLNRTNGVVADGDLYWGFNNGGAHELHSFAEQPTYDMAANASGRLYFYVCVAGDSACKADPTKSKYFDFIEHTIGQTQYNGNTTRVDAFGLKVAMRLHNADGTDLTVGENEATFAESRDATFAAFLADAPDEFKPLAQAPFAPYRIVEPGAAGFGTNGANAHYYDSFVDSLWSANGITIPKPGANGDGLGAYPVLEAAIFRHVGATAGSFDANGKLLAKTLFDDATTFYTAAPFDYYARFWHSRAINGKSYAFPYDDVGGWSSYISHSNPQSMLVAIGW